MIKKTKIIILFISFFLFVFSAREVFAYQDIGLRVFNGEQTVSIAVEDTGTLTSPLRIARGGVTYGVVLVDSLDLCASGVNIKTSAGVQSLSVYPCVETAVVITPNTMRRNGTALTFIVDLTFPASIRVSDLDLTDGLDLYCWGCKIDGTDVRAKSLSTTTYSSPTRIRAPYDRQALVSESGEIYGYGAFVLWFRGVLVEGDSRGYFYGYQSIWLTRFAGD